MTDNFFVESIFGVKHRRAFVRVHLGGASITVNTEDAREFAANLLASAEAAESDEFLYRFFIKAGKSEKEAAEAIKFYRELRTEWAVTRPSLEKQNKLSGKDITGG